MHPPCARRHAHHRREAEPVTKDLFPLQPHERRERGIASLVLAAGAAVGVLDGLFAVTVCESVNPACTPARVFQSVAAGLLGRDSYAGGVATAALGLALHFAIAATWSAIYLALVRRSARLREIVRRPGGAAAVGLAFGPLVWLVMRFVVIPVSAATSGPVRSWVFVVMLAGHALVVGLPIALIVRDGEARRPREARASPAATSAA
jgi:hypothetical protein